jgi:KaiC/GvpD/RAD55 family RecA-like ATPase
MNMTSLLEYTVKEYDMPEFVGSVFRKGKVGIIYGASGLGKTVSTIKALNEDGEKPILIDFDENDTPEVNGCEYYHIDGSEIIDRKSSIGLKMDIDFPKDKVYIIDTWSVFKNNFETEHDAMKAVEYIKDITGGTIIIVSHNKDIATKRDIPMMDEELVNHLGFKLYLEEGSKKEPEPTLVIKKLRGYDGSRRIYAWMREEETDLEKVIK